MERIEELRAELAALEADEPECSCAQIDVDQFDCYGCGYHNPSSEWNRSVARVQHEIDRLTPVPPSPLDTEYEYYRDLGWFDSDKEAA